MNFVPGPIELGLILLIVAMLFGVGKLPEVFGSVGKGIREFRKESGMEGDKGASNAAPAQTALPGPTASTPAITVEQPVQATAEKSN